MSAVLYLLGAALAAWGGYVLLTGGMVATLDIAATLFGYGVFAIGLGAVAGGLNRVARALADPVRPREPISSRDAKTPAVVALEPEAATLPPIATVPPAQAPVTTPGTAETPAPAKDPPVATGPRSPSATNVAARITRPLRPRLVPAKPAFAAAAVEPPPEVAPVLGNAHLSRPPSNGLDAVMDGAAPRPAAPAAQPQEEAPETSSTSKDPLISETRDAEEPALVADPITEPDAQTEPVTDPARSAEVVADPPLSDPDQTRAVEPKIPDWLARARARREAKARAGGDGASPPAAAGETPVVVEPPPPQGEPAPAAPSGGDSTPAVVSEGEHNGVVYRFFTDGVVEAMTEHGVRRFASLEEFRATVLSVRGQPEAEPEAEPDPDAELASGDSIAVEETVAAPPDHAAVRTAGSAVPAVEITPSADPSDAASEQPDLRARRADDEFEAALAALEGSSTPSLADVRPGRER